MTKSNADNCYICIGKINNPVYPSGCNHGFYKEHLKVNLFNLIIKIILEIEKLECGICRLPFKKEYFGDDLIIKELFPDNRGSRPNRVSINMIDNDNINQNDNHNNNIRENQNQNIRIIQNENNRINSNNNNHNRRQNSNNSENNFIEIYESKNLI